MNNYKISIITLCSAITLLFWPGAANAQEGATSNTLLGSGKLMDKDALGFFVAPAYGYTQMDGSDAHLFHVRAGATFKDRWALGAFYNVSMNEIRPASELLTNVYMDYWALGGFLEFTAWSKKLAHVSFPLYVGMGEVEMDNEAGEARLGEANFFQIEPSALLELNLHKYVRFNLGAGYRIVGDMTYRNFNQSDISGFTGYVGLKFGLFD